MIEFIFRPIDRWPQEPTRNRKAAQFRAKYTNTLALLRDELQKLGVRRAYIQADVRESEIRLDGQLRADARPASPRVIVAAETKHGHVSLPCDTYTHWQDNLRAIALSLEALRAVDRYGVTKRGEQYRGLKQLGSGEGPVNRDEAAAFLSAASGEAVSALEILRNYDRAKLAYRNAAKRLHPDVATTDTRSEWDRLQRALAILSEHHGRSLD